MNDLKGRIESLTWSKESCEIEAAKFENLREWILGSSCSYLAALGNGWLHGCVSGFDRKRKSRDEDIQTVSSGNTYQVEKWNKEDCFLDATQYGCRKEWEKKSSGYVAACVNGWLSEIIKRMKEHASPSKLECIQDASKYRSINEWERANPNAVKTARLGGFLAECKERMQKQRVKKWTLEECIAEAKKHSNRLSWMQVCPRSHSAASKRKEWFKQCASHFTRKVKYSSVEEVKKELSGYTVFEYWKMCRSSTYRTFLDKGFRTQIHQHFDHHLPQLTEQRCKESARRFQTCGEWHSSDPESYFLALERDWFSDCILHMEPSRYTSWLDFFKSEPIRFINYYHNKKWEDCFWLGLEPPYACNKRQMLLQGWSAEDIDALKSFGVKGSVLARAFSSHLMSKKPSRFRQESTVPDDPFEMNLVIRGGLTKQELSRVRGAFRVFYGSDEVVDIVLAVFGSKFPTNLLKYSDESFRSAFQLVLKSSPMRINDPDHNFRTWLALSLRVKRIFVEIVHGKTME